MNQKDKQALKDKLTGKSKKSEESDQGAELDGVDPEKAGCEVTEFSKQSMLLVGSYNGLDVLV